MKFWSEPTSKDAFILAWASVVLTLAAAIIGIDFYYKYDSTLCLVYGLENCVDLMSSIVVVWRFYAPGDMTKEREELLAKREKRASMAISFILILLGLFVTFGAVDDLIKGPESPFDMDLILEISLVSIIVFGTLVLFKFHYSKKLHSASLYKDGLCSMLGTVLSGALFFNTMIIEKYPTTWWLDPGKNFLFQIHLVRLLELFVTKILPSSFSCIYCLWNCCFWTWGAPSL